MKELGQIKMKKETFNKLNLILDALDATIDKGIA